MSAAQNLGYATIQIAHNFGAMAAVGGSLSGAILKHIAARRNLAWLALAGWGTQALSGAAFGAASYYFYRKLPDISGTAEDALMVKMACVATGLALLGAYLVWGESWTERKRNGVWYVSTALAIIALSAAAVLRWFS
jgi:hypothetical protein